MAKRREAPAPLRFEDYQSETWKRAHAALVSAVENIPEFEGGYSHLTDDDRLDQSTQDEIRRLIAEADERESQRNDAEDEQEKYERAVAAAIGLIYEAERLLEQEGAGQEGRIVDAIATLAEAREALNNP